MSLSTVRHEQTLTGGSSSCSSCQGRASSGQSGHSPQTWSFTLTPPTSATALIGLFNAPWTPAEFRHITWRELYVVVVAQWKILFHCDNAALVPIWQRGSYKFVVLVHTLFFFEAKIEYIAHIPPHCCSSLLFVHAGLPASSTTGQPVPWSITTPALLTLP